MGTAILGCYPIGGKGNKTRPISTRGDYDANSREWVTSRSTQNNTLPVPMDVADAASTRVSALVAQWLGVAVP
jgi:hypothetical protein